MNSFGLPHLQTSVAGEMYSLIILFTHVSVLDYDGTTERTLYGLFKEKLGNKLGNVELT